MCSGAVVGGPPGRAAIAADPRRCCGHCASRRSAARSRASAPSSLRRSLRIRSSVGGPSVHAPGSIPNRESSSSDSSQSAARPWRSTSTCMSQRRSVSSSGRDATSFAAIWIATIARCDRRRAIPSSANSVAFVLRQRAASRSASTRFARSAIRDMSVRGEHAHLGHGGVGIGTHPGPL
jgi:hypothetical protein